LINRAHEGASMDALGQSVTTISQKASRTDEIAVHLRAMLAQDDESSMTGVKRARRIMAMYGPADERDLATASAIELRFEPGESQNVATSDAPVSTRLRAAPRAAVRPVADGVQADAAPI